MIQATAPPPDDSYKWFITIIKQPSCEPCARLLSDFQKAPELLAFVSAVEPYKAWAHFVVYDRTDATQQFRLKDYKISGFPTLVVQPPLNGTWGPPGTVVWQTTGYDGNPKTLSQNITKYVRLYAATMGKKGYPRPPQTYNAGPGEKVYVNTSRFRIPSVEGGSRQAESISSGPIGVDPPFPSPPKVDPFNPQPVGPSPLVPATPNWPPADPMPAPNANPNQTPVDLPAWAQLIQAIFQMIQQLTTGSGTTNLLLLLTTGFLILERVAPLTKRVTLDDRIVAILKPYLDPSGPGPGPAVVLRPTPVPGPTSNPPAPTGGPSSA